MIKIISSCPENIPALYFYSRAPVEEMEADKDKVSCTRSHGQ